jgi:hypothetical protein
MTQWAKIRPIWSPCPEFGNGLVAFCPNRKSGNFPRSEKEVDSKTFFATGRLFLRAVTRRNQGCQIFLGTIYQNREIYQITTKYTKSN